VLSAQFPVALPLVPAWYLMLRAVTDMAPWYFLCAIVPVAVATCCGLGACHFITYSGGAVPLNMRLRQSRSHRVPRFSHCEAAWACCGASCRRPAPSSGPQLCFASRFRAS
jgi:hypothetical protein